MWLGWPSSRDLHPGLYDVAPVGAPSEKGCGLVGRHPGIRIPGFTMSPPLGNAVKEFLPRSGRGTSALFRAALNSEVIAQTYQGLAPWLLTQAPFEAERVCLDPRNVGGW